MPRALLLVLLASVLLATPSFGQVSANAGKTSPRIQDNSFLVEEAYNQEDGVIQHISAFERLTASRDWVYTQTDEWPLRSYKHQLSVTLAATHAGSFAGSGAGWGDTAFNYRYQLIGSGETKIAFAPRFTVLLPTGDRLFGRGSGGLGVQTNLPVSIQHSAHWVTHWNAGASWVPRAIDSMGDSATTTGVNLGQSFVWLATPRINFLLETLWTSSEAVVASGKTLRSQNLYVSPGIRWAHNLKHGLQIVPGIAVPVGVGPSAGDKGLIVYLSFEHPFRLAHSKVR
ncbi:MAG TPA: hypothetical protein VJ453_04005 [Terriglobales bacterium]|jgi:hypothetical protein|nr:hypothetical protein [Terriglobales bacterium]